MAILNEKQLKMCAESKWDFSDLKALFINCTLKRSPELSHTQGLIDISQAIMEKNGVSVEALRAVDYDIAYGVWPDMKEHGWKNDQWPSILDKVMASDILVLPSSTWLGEKSSVCTKVIERLYAASGELNSGGQYAYYSRVGGCLVTGNDDGAKHCAMNILYSLQHIGYVIPPQADAAWCGERPCSAHSITTGRAGLARANLDRKNPWIRDETTASPGFDDATHRHSNS